jgi:peptidyl-prolyl cis-trans isomerase C
MKNHFLSLALTLTLGAFATGALAQNIALVNGKAVPKSRVQALAQQLERSGRPRKTTNCSWSWPAKPF